MRQLCRSDAGGELVGTGRAGQRQPVDAGPERGRPDHADLQRAGLRIRRHRHDEAIQPSVFLDSGQRVQRRHAGQPLDSVAQQRLRRSVRPRHVPIAARNVVSDLTTIAELEDAKFVMTIQDPSNPADTRFLHVLQGADAGAGMVPATYAQSTAGTAFDGSIFGGTAVWFPVNAASSPVAATLPAPAGVHTAMVTGLAPNGSYSVTVTGNAITDRKST